MIPPTISPTLRLDFVVADDTAAADVAEAIDVSVVMGVSISVVVAEVTVVAEVSAVVMATGGTSPGSRTVYLTSQNIIKSIRHKRIAAHESIYDDKWWASLRHGGDDSMLAVF
jgi:hypothetical protein